MSIERMHTSARMSQAVKYQGVVYLAGQVAKNAAGESVEAQTRDILTTIDTLLAQAGSSKAKLISATIWLADMASFDEMNAVWDAWVVPDNTPARACVEARLASPRFTVEIAVVAAA